MRFITTKFREWNPMATTEMLRSWGVEVLEVMEAEQWPWFDMHMGGGLRMMTLFDHADSNGLDTLLYIDFKGHTIWRGLMS